MNASITEGRALPAVLTAHLAAHEARDAERELACYADDAEVTDEGRTYRGLAEIRSWLSRAASEYTYTSELTAVRQDDDTHWTAVRHLEGDFPGGVVDLRYRYTLHGDHITELVIAP
ncbi:nuclear transport factor 2 family protein [Promicromonospora sp. MEB111]|uniref:nuclear transport factor 2 family protein n=1 Tax=unclassified Promicromonospora TaxID=2647929 RepID=UPI00254B63DC|nr:nuclear transport factor 2 family protein [Promicromonospora sp. MEB111]